MRYRLPTGHTMPIAAVSQSSSSLGQPQPNQEPEIAAVLITQQLSLDGSSTYRYDGLPALTWLRKVELEMERYDAFETLSKCPSMSFTEAIAYNRAGRECRISEYLLSCLEVDSALGFPVLTERF